MKIAILLLAAGSSSRMGRPKQLLPWKNTTLIGHAVTNALDSIATEVYVVLGARRELIESTITDKEATLVYNPDWRSGISSSIQCGLQAIRQGQHTPEGVLIMLCDQPLIDSEYLNQLILKFMENPSCSVATLYPKGRLGVPALFEASSFALLAELSEDEGAQTVLNELGDRVIGINAEGKTLDIDTQDDYNSFFDAE